MELSFLSGQGEMARRIRSFDWSGTGLGPPAAWPTTLRAMVRLMLSTRHPMCILWGAEHIGLYNDAFSAIRGPEKHAGILGLPGAEAWPERWALIATEVDRVMRGVEAAGPENRPVPVASDGGAPDGGWTCSIDPIADESAPSGVGGVLVICTRTPRPLARSADPTGGTAATPLLQSDAGLRQQEEQLRLATDAADIGLWDVDVASSHMYWPPRVKAMFGISADVPVTLDDYYRGVHPLDAEHTLAAFASALDPVERRVYDVEYRTVGKEDQRIRWVAAKGRGIFDAAGTCVRVIGTAIDITARKAADVRLRELNETLEQRVAEALAEKKVYADIVEGTDAFVQLLDPNHRILAINKACADEFERLFQVRPAVGDNLLALLDDRPEARATVEAAWRPALAGEEYTATLALPDASGRMRHYEAKFNTLRDAAGERVGAYQFVQDVTARIEAAARLAEAEESLRQAQKMEAVGKLTGGIAHDFNNVLQVIQGSLTLIHRITPEEKVRRWSDAALRSVRRGAELTSQLLTFARKQPIEPRVLRVAGLLGGMEDMLQRTLGPLVRHRMVLDDAGAALNVDPTQLELAVLNLAINARDAMQGGGLLTIGTKVLRRGGQADLPAGDYVEIEVQDTGAGMPADVAARAFEPFFTTKDVGKGTGLGLSQVYGMARQAGGDATISSEPGKGTTVTLRLPRFEGAVDPAATARKPAPDPLTSASLLSVLVVDDDPEVRAVLVASLGALGHAVSAAVDGPSGLEALAGRAFDLMVCDFAMPGMNGAEVARRARQRRPELPIVFASGYADIQAIRAAVGAGSMVLRKPFTLAELDGAVRAVVRGRAGVDAGGVQGAAGACTSSAGAGHRLPARDTAEGDRCESVTRHAVNLRFPIS